MEIWVDRKPRSCRECPLAETDFVSEVMNKIRPVKICKLRGGIADIKKCRLQEVEFIDSKTVAIPTPNGKIIKRI